MLSIVLLCYHVIFFLGPNGDQGARGAPGQTGKQYYSNIMIG